MKSKKYKEIFKLKKMLEDADIPFYWQEISLGLVERYQICYPCFAEKLRVLSAIEGFSTYGAQNDLIEIRGLLESGEGDGMVAGYLTAENVFNRIKKHYNKKEGVFIMKKTIKVVDEDTLEIKEVEVKEDFSTDEKLSTFVNQLHSALNCEPEEFYSKYKNYKEAEAEFKKLYDPFKEKLIQIYKSTPNLPKSTVIGGVKLTYVSPSVRTAIDSKKLKEEEPELAKKFTKTTNVEANIRLSDT